MIFIYFWDFPEREPRAKPVNRSRIQTASFPKFADSEFVR